MNKNQIPKVLGFNGVFHLKCPITSDKYKVAFEYLYVPLNVKVLLRIFIKKFTK